MHLACRLRADRAHLEFIDSGVDGAFLRLGPIVRARDFTLLGQLFELTLQVTDVLVAKVLRQHRPRLAMARDDEIGIGRRRRRCETGRVRSPSHRRSSGRAVAARDPVSPCEVLAAPRASSETATTLSSSAACGRSHDALYPVLARSPLRTVAGPIVMRARARLCVAPYARSISGSSRGPTSAGADPMAPRALVGALALLAWDAARATWLSLSQGRSER